MAWWYPILPAAKAVVPTVLGGLIAATTGYFLARKASKETLKRDRTSRSENQKTAALRAVVKLQSIVNGMGTLHRQLEGAIAVAHAQGHKDLQLWEMVTPVVGFTDHSIRFEAEEIAAFVSKDAEYVNELLLLAERYASQEASFKVYAERRVNLTDAFPGTTTMDGAVGTTMLTKEEASRFAPRAFSLNSLLEQLRSQVAENYENALTLAEQFGHKARVLLSDPEFILINVSSARAEKAQIDQLATESYGPPGMPSRREDGR